MKKHKCKHFCIGYIHGKVQFCLFSQLHNLINCLAQIYCVCLKIPNSEKEKLLNEFKRFKYCPKCGEKLDFSEVEKKLFRSTEDE
jgi:hypothetical protein